MAPSRTAASARASTTSWIVAALVALAATGGAGCDDGRSGGASGSGAARGGTAARSDADVQLGAQRDGAARRDDDEREDDARGDDASRSDRAAAAPWPATPTAPPAPTTPGAATTTTGATTTTRVDAGPQPEPYWQTQRRRLREDEERRLADERARAENAPPAAPPPAPPAPPSSSPTGDADRSRRCEADFNRCMEHAKAVFAWTQQQTQPDGALLSYELALATAIDKCQQDRGVCSGSGREAR